MKKNSLRLFFLSCLFPATLLAQDTSISLFQLLEQHPDASEHLAENTEIYNLIHLNSEALDYSPVAYKNGLVFTSTRKTSQKWWKNLFKKEFAYLFYTSQRADGTFLPPLPLEGAINGRLNEGAATFSPDGKVMIFTRNSAEKNEAGQYDLKLYTADHQHGKWVNVRPLNINQENYTTCHPSLSPDGQQLYFSSNRPGGFGGMDLYVSTWNNNHWEAPVNLGAEINSAQHDLFPNMSQKGQLFYSSNNAQSMGNYDLFVSQKMLDGQWSATQHLGAPFNSSMDDFGLVLNADGQSGYFTSNREGGLGGDDIYAWQLTALPQEVINQPLLSQINIIDAQNKTKITNAQVRLYELNVLIAGEAPQGEAIAISNLINEDLLQLIGTEINVIEGEEGELLCPIQSGKKYLVKVDNEAHLPVQQLLSTHELPEQYTIAMENRITPFQLDISQVEDLPIPMVKEMKVEPKVFVPLIAATAIVPKSGIESPIEAEASSIAINELEAKMMKGNEAIRLSNIYYGFNQHELNTASKEALANLLELLQSHPKMEIRVSSHTDARGEANYNQQLSQRRADAVRNYLVEQGIAKKRISVMGYGESQLLNNCSGQSDCLEAEHEENRRTEFEVIKR